VTPTTIAKFMDAGDLTTGAILQTIYQEEITHVAAGQCSRNVALNVPSMLPSLFLK
jgi:uncharacterized ferritin-like protein (DUF455 family)